VALTVQIAEPADARAIDRVRARAQKGANRPKSDDRGEESWICRKPASWAVVDLL